MLKGLAGMLWFGSRTNSQFGEVPPLLVPARVELS